MNIATARHHTTANTLFLLLSYFRAKADTFTSVTKWTKYNTYRIENSPTADSAYNTLRADAVKA